MFLHFFDALCCAGEKIFCLSTSRLAWYKTQPAKESWGGGEEKPDFLRSKNVALCLFTSKAMAALRWFSSPQRLRKLKNIISL